MKKKKVENYQNIDTSESASSSGKWLLDWQNSPEVMKQLKGRLFVVSNNRAYMTYGINKEAPVVGPFTRSPDEDTAFIYTNGSLSEIDQINVLEQKFAQEFDTTFTLTNNQYSITTKYCDNQSYTSCKAELLTIPQEVDLQNQLKSISVELNSKSKSIAYIEQKISLGTKLTQYEKDLLAKTKAEIAALNDKYKSTTSALTTLRASNIECCKTRTQIVGTPDSNNPGRVISLEGETVSKKTLVQTLIMDPVVSRNPLFKQLYDTKQLLDKIRIDNLLLATYGIKDKCNIGASNSALCNGLVSLTDVRDPDANMQFKQLVYRDPNRVVPFDESFKYLIHVPTDLVVTFITVSQGMINAIQNNPIDVKFTPWNYFYVKETPDIFFPVSIGNKAGDIIPLVYTGNELVSSLPKTVTIALQSKPDIEFDVRLEIEAELSPQGQFLIRSNGKMVNTTYELDPVFGKNWRLIPTEKIAIGGNWKFVMPGKLSKCGDRDIYYDGACQTCPTGFYPNKNKTACVPNCPSGQFLLGGTCQVCDGVVSKDQQTCFQGGLKEIGYVDDDHVGQIRMADGTWLPVGDVLIIVAGPQNESASECFSYLSSEKEQSVFERENFRYYGGCSIKEPWNCIKVGFDWVAERAKDAYNFAKQAIDKIGDWAKDVSGKALDWAKGAGNTIARELVKFGNAFACGVRKIIKEVGEFFNKFGELARKAAEAIFNWFKDRMIQVWEVLKPILQTSFELLTGGVVCEYISESQYSPSDAALLLLPIVLPVIRPPVYKFIVGTISVVFPAVALVMEFVLPLVGSYLDPHVDKLLRMAFADKLTVEIVTLARPAITQLSFLCPDMSEPENIDSYDSMLDNSNMEQVEEPPCEFGDLTLI